MMDACPTAVTGGKHGFHLDGGAAKAVLACFICWFMVVEPMEAKGPVAFVIFRGLFGKPLCFGISVLFLDNVVPLFGTLGAMRQVVSSIRYNLLKLCNYF